MKLYRISASRDQWYVGGQFDCVECIVCANDPAEADRVVCDELVKRGGHPEYIYRDECVEIEGYTVEAAEPGCINYSVTYD